jgi:hypothetical protein
MIGLVGATLARTIQDFLKDGSRNDYLVTLSGSVQTS